MTDDDRLTRIRQRDARLTGYLTDAERDRRYLLTEIDRQAKVLRYAIEQYHRLLQVHENVVMDTEQDRDLHARVIAAFRRAMPPPAQAPDYTQVRDSVGEELEHHTPTCNHLIGRQHRECDCPYNDGDQ